MPLADDETSNASEDPASDRAVSNANAVKATGSHILSVAVGSGLDKPSSLARIIDVSGPDVFDGNGTFDIAEDDVYRVADFDDLEDAMREAAFQLCAPSITVRKLIDQTPDPGGPDDAIPGAGVADDGHSRPRTRGVGPAPRRHRRHGNLDHERSRVRQLPMEHCDTDHLGCRHLRDRPARL